jgi:hypothetical protein
MADHDTHSHELDPDAGPDHNRYQQQQQQQQPESEQQQRESEQQQPESPQQDPRQSPPPADQQAGKEEAGDAAAAAAADLQQQQQQQLNELEAVLRQADAVMEPDIMDRLRQYVVANGHPQAAVEYLTESYVGE